MTIQKRVHAAEYRLDWETARQIWSEIYDADCENREALLGLAQALRKLGRPAEAEAMLRGAPELHSNHLDYALSVAETAQLLAIASEHAIPADPVETSLMVLRRFPEQVYGYAASAVLLAAADCHEQATMVARMGRHSFGDAFERLMPEVGAVFPDMHRAVERQDWAAAAAAIARVRAGISTGREFLPGLAELESLVDLAIGLDFPDDVDTHGASAVSCHDNATDAAASGSSEPLRAASIEAIPAGHDRRQRHPQRQQARPRPSGRRVSRGLAIGLAGLTLVGVVAARIGFDTGTKPELAARPANSAPLASVVPRPAGEPRHSVAGATMGRTRQAMVTLAPHAAPHAAPLGLRTDNVVVAVPRPHPTPEAPRTAAATPTHHGTQAPGIAATPLVTPAIGTEASVKNVPRTAVPSAEPIHVTLQYGSGDAGALARATHLLAQLRGQGMLVVGPIALDRPVEHSQIGYSFAQDQPAADRLAQLLLSANAAADLLATPAGALARPGEISVTIGARDMPVLEPPAAGKQT